MPGRYSLAGRRRGLAALCSIFAIIASVVPWTFATPAQATTIPTNFFTVSDTGGPNDAVGQGDLTQLGRDDTDPTTYFMFWSWDNATWPGANTGDACALFDTNNDTKIDYAVCAEIGSSGANVVQTANSPTVWTCNDSKTDRCAGPSLQPNTGVTVTALGGGVSPPADLITDTDPFSLSGGTDEPKDSTIEIKILKADLPSGASLTNVCSYPSIGSGGNTDPKDCVANAGGGFLQIVKDAGGDTTTVFPFTSAGSTVDVQEGSPSSQSVVVGTNYSISENVPAGWLFDSASCTLEGGGSTGTASGTGVTGITVESGKITTCNVKDEKASPHITLVKTSTDTSVPAVGQSIPYKLVATNDGNVDLTNVQISDTLLSSLSCTPALGSTLHPTDTMTCTGGYTVQQSDIDAGKVDNTGTATGTAPDNSKVQDTDSVHLAATQNAAIDLTKTPSSATYDTLGQTITYTLDAKNTGNVTLHDVEIPTDTLLGGPITSPCTVGGSSATPPVTLAPGDTLECKPTYSITQSDLDNGSVDNKATATGKDPGNNAVSDDATATIQAVGKPGFTLTKDASPSTYSKVGDVITYTLTEKNTGNVTLGSVGITDPMFNGGATLTKDCTVSGTGVTPPISLAPGDSLVCSVTHTIDQSDLDAGSIHNTATGHGTPPGASEITHDASATVTGLLTKSIDITKKANPTTYSAVGDVIGYTIVATNNGNVTLTNVTVADPSVSNLSCTPATPVASLAPGDHIDCTADHTITQADMDAGHYDNTATATGTPIGGGSDVTDQDSATVTTTRTPAISLDKVPDTNPFTSVGQKIGYKLTATNTGNVTLTNVQITDPLVGGPVTNCSPALGSSLAPADTMTCDGTYTITQADLDAGKFTNTAHTVGTAPGNLGDVTADKTVTIDGTQTPGLTVSKVANPTTFSGAGQTITYTVTATNTGNVTLSQFGITDPLLGGLMTSCTDGAAGVLNPPVKAFAPGAVMVCTAQYTTTATDVRNGSVANTATGQGNDPTGAAVSATGSATVTFVAPPAPPAAANLVPTKTSVPASGSFVQPGDTVTYTLGYSNTGGSAANPVTFSDQLPADMNYVAGSASNGGTYDAATRTVSWNLGNLAAGATGSVTFAATVASTATNGEVLDNIAVLTAPGVSAPSNPDTLTVSVPTGALTITKAVDKTAAEFGDTLKYSIKVAATGNKDQTDVVVTDTVPAKTTYVDGSATCDAPCTASEAGGVVTWNVGTLAAGASTVVTFKVKIDTPASAANGAIPAETINNEATVSSTDDPGTLSNRVKTAITAVLGVKHRRTIHHEHSPLPFTGLPFPMVRVLTMAIGAVGLGSLMVQAARSRRRMTAGITPPADE